MYLIEKKFRVSKSEIDSSNPHHNFGVALFINVRSELQERGVDRDAVANYRQFFVPMFDDPSQNFPAYDEMRASKRLLFQTENCYTRGDVIILREVILVDNEQTYQEILRHMGFPDGMDETNLDLSPFTVEVIREHIEDA